MLDTKLLRSDPESVARNLARRGFVLDVARFRALEERRKVAQVAADETRSARNAHAKKVGMAKGKGGDMIHDPEVLILDEPTDGLDPNQKYEVRNLVRGLGRTKAVVFSTHILEEVDAACTRAIIIDRGRVVAQGTPDELGRPLDEVFRRITTTDTKAGPATVKA